MLGLFESPVVAEIIWKKG